jgi:acetyl-CoA C-acetyltransferase
MAMQSSINPVRTRLEASMKTPLIIGWGHTAFGKQTDRTLTDLISEASQQALDQAGLQAKDIDAVFVGHFNGGFVDQDFTAPLVALALPDLRFTPATRLENACATGSAAIWAARDAVMAGRVRNALVVGFEKMTERDGQTIGDILLRCSYVAEEAEVPGGFAGIFGQIAEQYFNRFGDQRTALAQIAAKNHANGVGNPYAQLRKDLGFEFCNTVSDKNPQVAGPLRRTDCSMVSDGAAALVISAEPAASQHGQAGSAIRWLSATQTNDYMPMRMKDPTWFEGAARAWQKGLADAKLGLRDLSLIETHDCFTIAELMHYEAMGLAPHGQGARVIADGLTTKSGALPINPSGGLKSKGHPIGATGVSMHVMACLQLTHTAGDMQIPNAQRAAVFNMGGTAVANYLSILQAA